MEVVGGMHAGQGHGGLSHFERCRGHQLTLWIISFVDTFLCYALSFRPQFLTSINSTHEFYLFRMVCMRDKATAVCRIFERCRGHQLTSWIISFVDTFLCYALSFRPQFLTSINSTHEFSLFKNNQTAVFYTCVILSGSYLHVLSQTKSSDIEIFTINVCKIQFNITL